MPLKRNDIIVSGAVRLLEQLKSDSIPLIIADPPYGIEYRSNRYKGKNPHAPTANDWNFQIGTFIQECGRVLQNTGAMYLFSRWDVYPLWLPMITTSNLKLKTKIVWIKNNWSAGDLAGCFGNQYEEILFIVKGRHLLRGKRWSNVWEFAKVPAKQMLHPTQKPTLLLRRAITSSSDLGDCVVDPFAGSGSTGEAALLEGRQFILGDIDPRMVNIARSRLNLPALLNTSLNTDDSSSYIFEAPTPSEWGIHPEELRLIYDEIITNRKVILERRDTEVR